MAGTPLVLIIDDDPDMVLLISKILTNMGLETMSASKSDKAITMLHSRVPTIITLDIDLAGANGLNFLKYTKKNKFYAHIPVIVFTAQTSPKLEAKAMEFGAFKFIKKPLVANALIMIAKQALKQAESFKLEKVFNDGEANGIVTIQGDVTEISELSFTLISSIKFSPKDKIEVTSSFFQKMDVQGCSQRVNSHLGASEGGFKTLVSFVGITDTAAKQIRSCKKKV